MKIKIATLGCRNNQYESSEIRASFEMEGFQPVPFDQKADICVINTCSVTEKSNYRCRQLIRKAANSDPESFIIVVGCYSQLDPEAIKSLPGVNLILGNEEKLDTVRFLKELNVFENRSPDKRQQRPTTIIGNPEESSIFRSVDVKHFDGKTKAFLKIQTGCSFKCSFCVIKLARGKSRSSRHDEVVRKFKILLKNGFKEITLSGIHLGSYGRDLSPATNFNELLKLLIKIKGNFRIRLSSLGPGDIDDELIDLIAGYSKICNHLHVSLQSGSDKILRLMKRNYRIEHYRKLVDKIVSRVTGIGLGADIIVGFPGETDKEFDETINVVKETPFSYLHVFSFSRRKNTAAYYLPDQVPPGISKKRVSALKELGRQKSIKYKESFLGKNLKVLVENNRDPVTGMLKGYTENYLPVHFTETDKLMNQIVSVRLSHIKNDILFGTI